MVLDGLDVEAQGGVDDAGVLAVNLQHNGSLPGVVQSAVNQTQQERRKLKEESNKRRKGGREKRGVSAYTMRIRISFSFFFIFLIMLRSPICSGEIEEEDQDSDPHRDDAEGSINIFSFSGSDHKTLNGKLDPKLVLTSAAYQYQHLLDGFRRIQTGTRVGLMESDLKICE